MHDAAESDRVASSRIRLLLAAMVRRPEIYKQYSIRVQPSHIQNVALSYFYLRLRELLDSRDPAEHITVAELRAEIRAQLEQTPNLLDWSATKELKDFLKKGLSSSYCADIFANHKLLLKLIHTTVRDLLFVEAYDAASRDLLEAEPSQLTQIVKRLGEKCESIVAQLGSLSRRLTFDPNWDKQQVYEYVPTGIRFLDNLMEQGMCRREVNIFMAPFGTCKTSTAVHLLVNGAWASYGAYLEQEYLPEEQRTKGLSVLVSYEALMGELQYRVIQCAARVEVDSLKNMKAAGVEALNSDGMEPLEYEKRYFRQEIEDDTFESEKARVQKAIPWLNDHTLILDFTSTAGSGGVDEIVAEITKELLALGENYYIHSVMIDYAGLMVDRYAETQSKFRDDGHKALAAVVGELRRKISIPFNTPVMLFHQLTGAANKQGKAIRLADKTDAKGSASFSEHAANAIVASHLNEEGAGLMANQKFRRSGKIPPTAFRLYGAMCRLEEAHDYTVDMSGALAAKSTQGGPNSGSTDMGDMPDVDLSDDMDYSNDADIDVTIDELSDADDLFLGVDSSLNSASGGSTGNNDDFE